MEKITVFNEVLRVGDETNYFDANSEARREFYQRVERLEPVKTNEHKTFKTMIARDGNGQYAVIQIMENPREEDTIAFGFIHPHDSLETAEVEYEAAKNTYRFA